MVIFGAGIRGKRCLRTLQEAGICVDFFCDNNEKIWGNTVEGIPVISPEELQENNIHSEILIANKANLPEIRAQLQLMGADKIRTLEEIIFFHTRLFSMEGDITAENKKRAFKHPEVSVIILGETEISGATRSSIAAQSPEISYEILSWHKNLSDIKGEKILFLQNGEQLQKDALKELLELQRQKGGVAGSKSVDKNGYINQAGYVLVEADKVKCYGYGEKAVKPEYEYVRSVDAVSVSGMLTEAKYLPQLSELIEKSDTLVEASVRISMWMKTLGQKVWFTPFSIVLSETAGMDCCLLHSEALIEECRRYLEKSNDGGDSLFWKANREACYCHTLVADFGIAQFDKNAGNRSTYNYIQIFHELGMWIIYLIDDYYYEYSYVKIFQKMGIFVLYGDEWNSRWNQLLIPFLDKIDYAFLNRPNITEKYADIIRKNSNALIVHYGHDLHYLRLKREYEITGDLRYLEESEKFKQIEYGLIHKVDITGYPSTVEVALMKKQFPEAEIQNFPLYFYDSNLSELKEEGREGILFVGGFAHRPNEDAAVWLVQDILPKLRKRGIQDKVYLAGSNPTEQVLNLQSEDVIVTGYVSDEELNAYYSRCFVDILPLRYGAGMKGKLLEAMYEGIPVVTTDIGAEGLEFVEDVVDVGNTVEEIVAKVTSLYAQKGKLKGKMEAERAYMRAYFGRDRMKDVVVNHLVLKAKIKERTGDSYR